VGKRDDKAESANELLLMIAIRVSLQSHSSVAITVSRERLIIRTMILRC
jgi:hypothetical protein